ncbi:MTH1187 family thiamine-binding protein [Tepidibacillus marianensis]|uniref:MTH1187 family thiamine-binding protein n=1 Tax=Tepidibacillus marianensis TaxID=3131995 RepID=UPI0030D4F32C
MAIVELTITPLGTGSPSVSQYVANVHKVLEEALEPVKFQLTAMSTIIEGDLKDIIAVIMRMHEVPFENGALRVSTLLRIDDRRDKQASIEQKLNSVNEKLGHKA